MVRYITFTLAPPTTEGWRPDNTITIRADCIESVTTRYEEPVRTTVVTTSGQHWIVMEDFDSVMGGLSKDTSAKDNRVKRFFHHDDPAVQAAMILLEDCKERGVDGSQLPSEGAIANIIRTCYGRTK